MNVITSVQFKRGTKEALEQVLVDDKKPLRGEPIWETDTNKLKLGDGENDYKDLPYLAGGSSDPDRIVALGYYDSEYDMFWKEEAKINPLPRLVYKLYKDLNNDLLYFLGEDDHYATVFTIANARKYGLVKLYSESGDNEDGSMTQKAITSRLKKKIQIELEDATPEDPEDNDFCLKMIEGLAD